MMRIHLNTPMQWAVRFAALVDRPVIPQAGRRMKMVRVREEHA